MGSESASWSICFCLLLLMFCHGNGAREMMVRHAMNDDDNIIANNVLRLHMRMDGNDQKDHDSDHVHKGANVLQQHHAMDEHDDDDSHVAIHTDHGHSHGHGHTEHMDPASLVFFFIEDLRVGKRIPIYFPNRDPSSSPQFLPKEKADSIPFSLKQLPKLLQFFSFPQGSPQAKAMEDTLRECEIKPIKGETKLCATSLESMLGFVHEILGSDTQLEGLSTTHLTKSKTLLQNYTISVEPKEILAPKTVACHTMPFPYAILYCHYQESESKVFKVLLEGDNGERVEAVAVCHMDTSQWGTNHVSFRVLGVEPGSSPVCHFFPSDNLVWVALPDLKRVI